MATKEDIITRAAGSNVEALEAELREADAEIERLRAALKPFAEWDEADESTHGFLSDPAVWAAAKAAYEQ